MSSSSLSLTPRKPERTLRLPLQTLNDKSRHQTTNLTIYWIYENEQPELVNYFWNEFYMAWTRLRIVNPNIDSLLQLRTSHRKSQKCCECRNTFAAFVNLKTKFKNQKRQTRVAWLRLFNYTESRFLLFVLLGFVFPIARHHIFKLSFSKK